MLSDLLKRGGKRGTNLQLSWRKRSRTTECHLPMRCGLISAASAAPHSNKLHMVPSYRRTATTISIGDGDDEEERPPVEGSCYVHNQISQCPPSTRQPASQPASAQLPSAHCPGRVSRGGRRRRSRKPMGRPTSAQSTLNTKPRRNERSALLNSWYIRYIAGAYTASHGELLTHAHGRTHNT